MNHPIFLGNVQTTLQNLPGVINVVDLKIYNIFGSMVGPSPDFRTIDPESGREYAPPETGTYRNNNPSPVNIYNNKYLMNSVDNVILCWPDTIFEVKYPDSDIIGHVI
jgi:hypothetical protein